MNKSLKALASQRSTLEALKIQGRSLLARGNVSMEEVDDYIEVADAVVPSENDSTIGTTVPETHPDADSKLELAVMEVDRRLEITNDEIAGTADQIPPADAVVNLDSEDDVAQIDEVINEAEELDALGEFGMAIQEDSGLDPEVALESYKGMVVPALRALGVSQEQLDEVLAAASITQIVPIVEEVNNVADAVVEKITEATQEVSTESVGVGAGAAHLTIGRARSYLAAKKSKKGENE